MGTGRLANQPGGGLRGATTWQPWSAEQHGVYVSQEFVRGGKFKLNRNVVAKRSPRPSGTCSPAATSLDRCPHGIQSGADRPTASQDHGRTARHSATGMKTADALMKGKEVGMVDLMQAQLEFRKRRYPGTKCPQSLSSRVANAGQRGGRSWLDSAALGRRYRGRASFAQLFLRRSSGC